MNVSLQWLLSNNKKESEWNSRLKLSCWFSSSTSASRNKKERNLRKNGERGETGFVVLTCNIWTRRRFSESAFVPLHPRNCCAFFSDANSQSCPSLPSLIYDFPRGSYFIMNPTSRSARRRAFKVGTFTVLSHGTGGSRSPFAPSAPEATREVYTRALVRKGDMTRKVQLMEIVSSVFPFTYLPWL